MKVKVLRHILLLVLLCTIQAAFSQIVQVKAEFDTSDITIGDQLNYIIEVKKEKDVNIKFPQFKDKLTDNIEIIAVSPLDSSWSKTEQKVILRQNVLVTAFDSGTFFVPALKVEISNDSFNDTIETSAAFLQVHSFPVDTTGTIRDIKGIEKAPVTLRELIPYLMGAIIIAVITWFLMYYLKKRKNNEPIFVREKPAEPAHVIAYRELDRLKGEKIWQRGQVKIYYSRLTEIIRKYLENRFDIIAMEQTTDEVLIECKEQNILTDTDFSLLRSMLTLADLVKFAKAEPSPDENEGHIENAYIFVNNTKYQGIPSNPEAPAENVISNTNA